MNKSAKIFLPVFISLSFFLAPAFPETSVLLPTSLPIPEANQIPKSVTVALLVDVPSVSIVTEGAYELRNKNGSELLLQGVGPFRASVRPQKGGIEINHQVFNAKHLVLDVPNGSIQVGNRRYNHQIQILKNSEKKLTVINHINLEEYLKGVLPLEAHPDWPIEVLKAHAVVTRTFALFKSLEKQGRDFTLHDTVQSQVYGGALFHKKTTDQAVEATRGEVLTFRGNIFPAYMHASCGGHTAQADFIWPVQPSPVLKGVVCPFCKGKKHWKWSLKMPLTEIETVMYQKGFPAKNLRNVIFMNRDPSGRATKVILEYERSRVTVSADDFRAFLGYNRLRSFKADVKVQGNDAYFRGFGWGHGIGFCQWGAKHQAELEKTYRQILEFYFPGSELKKI